MNTALSTDTTETSYDDTSALTDEPADQVDQALDGGASTEPFTSINPNELPPELKPHYRRMQADYTRKTQAIAEERRQAEILRQKAQQYAQLEPYLPTIQQLLATQRAAEQGHPSEAPSPDYSQMTPDQILAFEARRQAQPLVQEAVQQLNAQWQQYLTPIVQYLQQRAIRDVQENYTSQVQSAFQEFGEENVREYADAIIETIQRYPQLSVSDAYKILAYGQAKQQGAETVYSSLDAKRQAGSVERPRTRPRPIARGASTGDPFLDAVREAKAELAQE